MESFTIIGKKNWRQFLYCLECYDVPELQAFFRDPDSFLTSNRVSAFKEKPGDTTKVVRINIAGHDWVVKRYNVKGFGHWLRRCLLPSRAMVSWGNALGLFRAGIATPVPVAVIEQRVGPLRGVAYYITEYCEGTLASHFFRSSPDYFEYGEQVRAAIHHMTEKLHAAGFTHDDWQYNNILLVDYQPLALDLDHMRYFGQPSSKFDAAKLRDWDRLRRSAEKTQYSA
ncbi:MAG: lipopolysaccharide kinase InaA family protein [Gammaproteobacteria bacterium]|nr:lipopolysaccharide kinase InaA family protein [Gammaproteobacteria bacterium]